MPALVTKKLSEQFYFDARTRVYDQLNRLLLAVEDRIASLELIKTQLDVAIDNITELALSRLNDIFTPLIDEAEKRLTEFGANFSAISYTPLTLGIGGKVLSIRPEDKEGFVYADYVALRHRGGTQYMIAVVDSYDRPNGQLFCTVIDVTGIGTFADWDLRIAVPPDLSHAERRDNPHLVTASQVGAYTKAEADAQVDALNNVQSQVLTSTVQAQINQHATRSDNPHGVTALQVGALRKTGDTMTGNLTVPATVVSLGYYQGGALLLNQVGNYNRLYEIGTSTPAIQCGARGGDNQNYYDSDGHNFRGYNGSPQIGRFSTAGLVMSVGGISTPGNINLSGTVQAVGDINGADFHSVRAGSPTTGIIWLGNTGSRYLFFDGGAYQFPTSPINAPAGISTGTINGGTINCGSINASGNLLVSGIVTYNGGNISVTSSAGYLLQNAAGAHYIRSNSAIYIGDNNGAGVNLCGGGGLTSISGPCNVGGGLTAYSNVQVNGGINCNQGIALAGQLTANGYSYIRGSTLGYGGEGCTFGGSVQVNGNYNMNGQYTTGGYTYLRGTTLGWGGEQTNINGVCIHSNTTYLDGYTQIRSTTLGAGGENVACSGFFTQNTNMQARGYLEVLGRLYARSGIEGFDIGNPVVNMRMVYATDWELFSTGSTFERYSGGVLTGGIWNPQWSQPLFRWRYMQMQLRDGNWYTVSYA